MEQFYKLLNIRNTSKIKTKQTKNRREPRKEDIRNTKDITMIKFMLYQNLRRLQFTKKLQKKNVHSMTLCVETMPMCLLLTQGNVKHNAYGHAIRVIKYSYWRETYCFLYTHNYNLDYTMHTWPSRRNHQTNAHTKNY